MFHLGIDIGGTNIKLAVAEENDGKIILKAKDSFPFTKYPYTELCKKIFACAEKLLSSLNLKTADLTSIGIGVPGSIDETGKVLVYAHNMKYYNVPVVDEISKYFPGIPVFMDNDANVAALAELNGGAFEGKKNAILLTLGTGLGGGLIINGKIFNGGRNHGTEVAHLPFNVDDMPCTCGNRGCMQTYTCAPWIANKGKELLGDEYADAKSVFDLAEEGNATAKDIVDEYIENLSTAIAGLCSFLDPEVIALGGGVSGSGDILYKPLEKLVEQKNYYKVHYDVIPASMGNDAGVIGAAMLYGNSLK